MSERKFWSGSRAAILFWALYAAGTLVAVACLCRNGLFTHWHPLPDPNNYTWDPEAYYLGAGISLFWRPLIKIEGVGLHPGIPLLFLVQMVARTLYSAAVLFGERTDFYTFIAQHFRLFVTSVTFTMACLHVLASYVVYRVAMRLTGRFVVGVAAVFAYTTSICVFARFIHYNPERFTTVFNLIAVIWIVDYAEAAASGRKWKALAWTVLSALAVMSALLSKFYCASHMLVLLPLLILVWRSDSAGEKRIPLGVRLVAAAVFVLTSVFCVWLVSLKMSWMEFFQYWFQYAPGAPTYETSHSWAMNFLLRSGTLFTSGIKALVEKSSIWLPSHSGNWFTPAEWIFVLFSVIGFLVFVCVRPDKRRLSIALGLSVAFAYPMTTYAGGYPYVQFTIGVFAAFCAFLAVFLQDKILPKRFPEVLKLAVALALVVCLHYKAISSSIGVFRSQLQQYRNTWAAYYDAMDHVGPAKRIALCNAHRATQIIGTVDWWSYAGSPFNNAIMSRFVTISGKEPDGMLLGAKIGAVVERDTNGKTHWRPVVPDYKQGDSILESAFEAKPLADAARRNARQLLDEGQEREALRAVSLAGRDSGDPITYLQRLSCSLRPELSQKLWRNGGAPLLLAADFGAADKAPWAMLLDEQKRPVVRAGIDAAVTYAGAPTAFVEVGEPQNSGVTALGTPVNIPLRLGKVGVLLRMRADRPDDVVPFVSIFLPSVENAWFGACSKIKDEPDNWHVYRWEGNAVEFAMAQQRDPSTAVIKAIGISLKGPANRVWLGSIEMYAL